MSTSILTPRNFNDLELLNARAQNLPTGSLPAASAGLKGKIAYDTTLDVFVYCNGTAWVASGSGGGSDATTSAKGIVQLAGDLAGTAASPQIAAGVIVNADINSSAAIALSKLATDPLARANHTGSQLAASVSDFNTAVRTSRLDQMAAPTAAVAFNGQQGTGAADPTSPQDLATKAYADALAAGLRKSSSRAASTANQASLSGVATIDTVSLVAGDRVLLKNQTTAAQNGVYVVAAGAWSRAADMDAAGEVDGSLTIIEDGSQAGTAWVTVSEVTTLGTDAIVFSQFNSATDIVAGAGLSKSGLTLSVPTDGVTETMMAAGSVDLAGTTPTGTLPLTKGGTGGTTALAARSALATTSYYETGCAASTTTTIANATLVSAGINRVLSVQLVEGSTGNVVEADVSMSSAWATAPVITVSFAATPTASQYTVQVTGRA